MITDQAIYNAIVSAPLSPNTERVVVRHPQVLGRLIPAGRSGAGLDVCVTHTSEFLVGLRSPVALGTGSVYCLRVGNDICSETEVRVISSFPRPDGAFDVGAAYILHAVAAAAA